MIAELKCEKCKRTYAYLHPKEVKEKEGKWVYVESGNVVRCECGQELKKVFPTGTSFRI